MADYYVREEDGVSRYILEDGSGDYLLEQQPTAVAVPFIGSATVVHAPQLVYSGTHLVVTGPGSFQWLAPADVTSVFVECIGAGGGGGGTGTTTNAGEGGGGGGAYAARIAVPVTPGTLYTFVVGAGGAHETDGGSSSFTGDSSIQVIAVGGKGAAGITNGAGGAAGLSTGDTGRVFSGGDGGAGTSSASTGGAGGGASGNELAVGANGTSAVAGSAPGRAGGAGANGGGSGGSGGDYTIDDASPGSTPGGGGGGGGGFAPGASGGGGSVSITAFPIPFIPSVTAVYPPAIVGDEAVPFVSSVTTVYTPTLSHVANEVDVPFIASGTRVFPIFSLFSDIVGTGPGNGGETFPVRLAPSGTSVTATLAADISATSSLLEMTGDGGLPSSDPFVVTIDDEVLYIVQIAAGSYRIRGRGVSNTSAAGHLTGATVTWDDSYDMALVAGFDIAHSFTADIAGSGSTIYPGWLICFDSSQAYLGGSRYPTHVAQLLGVFDAGAGSTGTNRCDAAQPNAVCTPAGVSDDCPAGLSNPSRISSDILAGDVALVRYTNPEASALVVGPRSVAIQSWFGLKRVSDTDVDVTLTDPTGHVVDTDPSIGDFTGSVDGEWLNPLGPGISPTTGDPTNHDVPYTTVTLPGTDRFFTYGPPHYSEKGWPMAVLAVRQGDRRIPHWESWDWHDFSSVYSGFGTDDTFAQFLVNRNGLTTADELEVVLPGPQDITGPDAVWDDGSYYFGAAWYVAIFGTPYVVLGPVIGGSGASSESIATAFVPTVDFTGGPGSPAVSVPPVIEGGSGGGIPVPSAGRELFQVSLV